MKKRFLSILMALCLTLTLLPTAALAAEGSITDASSLAEVLGGEEYATVSGNVVTLQQNVTINGQDQLILQDATIVLDLNGKTLTTSSSIEVCGGTFTVEDGAVTTEPQVGDGPTYTVDTAGYSTGMIHNVYGSRSGNATVINVRNGGTLIHNSGTLKSDYNYTVGIYGETSVSAWETPVYSTCTINGGYHVGQEGGPAVFGHGATLNINGGVIEGIDNFPVAGNGTLSATENDGGYTININAGTLIARITSSGYVSCAIYHPNDGILNVEGGKIISTDGPGIVARAGTTNITGGTIIALGSNTGKVGDAQQLVGASGVVLDLATNYAGAGFDGTRATNAQVNISGAANISGAVSAVNVIESGTYKEDDNVIITGGTFTSNGAKSDIDSKYFPTGTSLTQNESGEIIADETTTVAEVNGVPYQSLKAAIEAAPAGATVTLVADAVLDANGITGGNGAQVLTIDKDLTIDGQGRYTIKGENFAENVRLITVTDNADVTFANVILDGNNTEGTPGTQDARHGLNLWNAGTVTLNNVTIKNCDWYAVANNGSNLIVNGLTTTGNAWGINLDNNATATINNANISETSSIVYENGEGGGSLTVNGGTFQNVVVQAESSTDVCGGRIDLKGGSFNDITTSGQGTHNDTSIVTVSGGTYQENVSKYLADGLAWNSSTGAVYDPSQNRPSSGSSSSDPTYSPVMDVSDGGTVRVNPRTPEEGDEVTITVDPDSGYEVDDVTVTDRSGSTVRVTAGRNGTYTFTQPRGRVTISVTFVREGSGAFFSDVPESFWAYDEIAWAYDNGYVNGTTAATFSPNASISRQQVWMILARLSGQSPASMAAAREWAVTNGVSDGTNPGSAVTRQQLVALLYRYATLMGYANDARADLSVYPDAGTVASYAVEPMQWSVANSIVAGTSDGILNPTGTATRAQFAVILYRFWEQVG